MNAYQKIVKEIAEGWYLRDCKEESSNRGVCVDEIKILYGDNIPRDEAWCAQFQWVLDSQTAARLHTAAKLPKTKGAKDLLTKAKKAGIHVDKIPSLGDVGYRFSNSGTGHNFRVVKIQSETKMVSGSIVPKNSIWTVEGNYNNRVGIRFYTPDYYNDPKNGVEFIHVWELYPNSEKILRPFH